MMYFQPLKMTKIIVLYSINEIGGDDEDVDDSQYTRIVIIFTFILFYIIFCLYCFITERKLNESCHIPIQCSKATPNSTCDNKTGVCECIEGHIEIANTCLSGMFNLFYCVLVNLILF